MEQNRQYQQKAHSDLRGAVAGGHRAPLYVSPTGSGKTTVAKNLIKAATEKRAGVLFLAPRRVLVRQTAKKLQRHGIIHGVIMAGETPSVYADVQVASVPTLHARAVKREKMPFPEARLILIDEAHLARGSMTEAILRAYPHAILVGLTATPCRQDGRGLGEVFDTLVLGPSVQELIDAGFLVPPKYFVPSSPDLSKVRVRKGEYNSADLGKTMDQATLVGDVLSNWLRLGRGRPTVIFTVNVAHSMHIETVFKQAGVRIAHMDANTPTDERERIMADLRSGKLECVTNCDVLTLGWDEPCVSCCVLARPTKSLTRYMQTVGRGLRPCPESGKQDCIVLDHGNCVAEHGLVEEPHEWSLERDRTVQERDLARKRERHEPKVITCADCNFVFKGQPSCPLCQWKVPHGRKDIHTVDDDLAELRNKKLQKREWSGAQLDALLGELKGYAHTRGFLSGWAAHAFKERMGSFPGPERGDTSARAPSPETLAWIKHYNIKRAKRREKQRRMSGVAHVGP